MWPFTEYNKISNNSYCIIPEIVYVILDKSVAVAKYAGRQLWTVILMSQVSKKMTVNKAAQLNLNV